MISEIILQKVIPQTVSQL